MTLLSLVIISNDVTFLIIPILEFVVDQCLNNIVACRCFVDASHESWFTPYPNRDLILFIWCFLVVVVRTSQVCNSCIVLFGVISRIAVVGYWISLQHNQWKHIKTKSTITIGNKQIRWNNNFLKATIETMTVTAPMYSSTVCSSFDWYTTPIHWGKKARR